MILSVGHSFVHSCFSLSFSPSFSHSFIFFPFFLSSLHLLCDFISYKDYLGDRGKVSVRSGREAGCQVTKRSDTIPHLRQRVPSKVLDPVSVISLRIYKRRLWRLGRGGLPALPALPARPCRQRLPARRTTHVDRCLI